MGVIAFDLGGTLMEYKGMPHSWVDYYSTGFHALNDRFHCNASNEIINESVEILKSYNPRINYREIEYSAEWIFEEALKKWDIESPIKEMIYSFFGGLQLKTVVYEETVPILKDLRKHGYKIAVLNDLPTAMPDSLFKNDIKELLPYLDLYVSSFSCGFRKPNPKGIYDITTYFGIDIDELLFVGDEEKDQRTAENAGCRFIKIVRNETPAEKLYTLKDLRKELLCS